jgi:hypothetical protein
MDWNTRLDSLEQIIDRKVEEDIKNYDILGQMPIMVDGLISIQMSAMLTCVTTNPQLAKMPDLTVKFDTIYDVITYNMKEILLKHGREYYNDTYLTNSS